MCNFKPFSRGVDRQVGEGGKQLRSFGLFSLGFKNITSTSQLAGLCCSLLAKQRSGVSKISNRVIRGTETAIISKVIERRGEEAHKTLFAYDCF
jgi:hypothetical protein